MRHCERRSDYSWGRYARLGTPKRFRRFTQGRRSPPVLFHGAVVSARPLIDPQSPIAGRARFPDQSTSTDVPCRPTPDCAGHIVGSSLRLILRLGCCA
jgi:hypothetical protein